MSDTTAYLTLGLDEAVFGIDIRNKREILDKRPVSKQPHAPSFLLGMVEARGAGFPIVDLRAKPHLARFEPTVAKRIIILDPHFKVREIGIGFTADRRFEVTTLDDEQTTPAPDVGARWASQFISGIGREGAAIAVPLDFDRLMYADDSHLASEALSA